VLWLLQHNAERHWLLALIAYVPQHGLLAPWLILAYGAMRKGNRRALAVYATALGFIAIVFLNVNLPFGLLAARQPTEKQRLRVASYSVKLSEGSASKVAAAIQNLNVDVVCAQEVPWLPTEGKAVAQLLRHLPNWHARHDGELLTLSRTPILSSRVHRVEKTGAVACQETVIRVGDQRVHFFNTHLTVPGENPRHLASSIRRTIPIRDAQIRAVVRAAQIKSPTILLGDFNTPARGRIYATLHKYWRDAWHDAGWGTGNSFPVGLPLVRIDYVWTSHDFQVQRCIVPNENASDHYPLVADLVLR
jgi:vancomycin resistance protein VanJ